MLVLLPLPGHCILRAVHDLINTVVWTCVWLRLMGWLRSSDGGQCAAQQIYEAGGMFSTAEHEGATRRAKACNPAGTNPADLDVTHALAAAGAVAVPSLLTALQQYAEAATNRVDPAKVRGDVDRWAAACSAAAVLGNANAVWDVHGNDPNRDHILQQSVAQRVCVALAKSASQKSHRWVRRNAVESLGTTGQAVSDCDTQVEVAHALVGAIAYVGQAVEEGDHAKEEQEQGDADQYDTEATVRVHAILSVARLANVWWSHNQRSGLSGLEALSAATPLLDAIVAGDDVDCKRGHRLSGTMIDYARHALLLLGRFSGQLA